jgi:hypothetical protein
MSSGIIDAIETMGRVLVLTIGPKKKNEHLSTKKNNIKIPFSYQGGVEKP